MRCWCDDGGSEENLDFDDESKQIVSFLFVAVFSNEKENRLSVFLSSYRNTSESLGEQEMTRKRKNHFLTLIINM